MPFIVQCPYPTCQKYMLFEDKQRGSTQQCLLCKQPIQLDPGEDEPQQQQSPPQQQQPPQPPPQQRKPPQQQTPAATHEIRTCPHCTAKVKVPSHVGRVKCPSCKEIF